MLSRDEFEKALESMLGAGALAIRNADRIESANHARCVHCLKTRDEHKLIEGIEDKCHYGPNSRVFQSEFDRAKVVEFVELLTSVLEMTGAVYDDIETLVLYRASARNKKGCELLNKNLEKSGETSRKNQNETTILERNDHVEPKNR